MLRCHATICNETSSCPHQIKIQYGRHGNDGYEIIKCSINNFIQLKLIYFTEYAHQITQEVYK